MSAGSFSPISSSFLPSPWSSHREGEDSSSEKQQGEQDGRSCGGGGVHMSGKTPLSSSLFSPMSSSTSSPSPSHLGDEGFSCLKQQDEEQVRKISRTHDGDGNDHHVSLKTHVLSSSFYPTSSSVSSPRPSRLDSEQSSRRTGDEHDNTERRHCTCADALNMSVTTPLPSSSSSFFPTPCSISDWSKASSIHEHKNVSETKQDVESNVRRLRGVCITHKMSTKTQQKQDDAPDVKRLQGCCITHHMSAKTHPMQVYDEHDVNILQSCWITHNTPMKTQPKQEDESDVKILQSCWITHNTPMKTPPKQEDEPDAKRLRGGWITHNTPTKTPPKQDEDPDVRRLRGGWITHNTPTKTPPKQDEDPDVRRLQGGWITHNTPMKTQPKPDEESDVRRLWGGCGSHHMSVKTHLLVSLLLLLLSLLRIQPGVGVSAEVFRDCGGFLEEPRGVVHSPGFPQRFPLPIACRWIIQAPPDKKIVLYFTQYFLRGAFYVTEYEQYVNELTYAGKKSLGQINFQDHIRTVVAYKPFLVLDFTLHSMANIHLRVEEYLEDVYGFNITYEVVDRAEHVRHNSCSVMDCSFLGHCLASADFSSYRCNCFPKFFGEVCQYGPYCDPDKGVNMCLNEGRCRYFYGSMVNVCECPKGYLGPKCEVKEDSLDEECERLGCSDHCQKTYDGVLYCVCTDGFKLNTDNVTCIEQEMFRVSVSVPLVKRPAEWDEARATTQAITILQLSSVFSATRFQYDGVNSSGEYDAQMFHFSVDRSELEAVSHGVKNLMRRNNLFNITVMAANFSMRVDPEMKLLSVEHYDDKPALEGKSMTLVCTARGSSRLQFRWYKDQFLFNASLTLRNAWEVRIQDELDDKQMSIFNVDGVTMFDKGEFSCEIEDFGETEQKSVTVDVMPLAQVEIKPLAASLPRGQPVSFRCLSPDENMRTFSYQWLRNGEELRKNSENEEIVEDLLPSGSRLFIPHLGISANYTCRVVNKAGAAEKSAFVFLISPNMSEMVCDSDALEGVKWNRTYGGYYDLQKCPIDTADFKVVGLEEGYARRDCVCDTTCAWGPPNYARCHSVHLVFLYEQLERCQLGYQLDGLSKIYDSLYDILRKAQNRTLAGDVDMFAINLHTLFDVTLRFPAVAPDPLKSNFNLKTVASFMNILLDEVKTTNAFEKQDLSVGARFLTVTEILAELARQNPSLIPLHNVTLPRIAFAVRNVTVVRPDEETGVGVGVGVDGEVVAGPSPSSGLAYNGRHLMSVITDLQLQGEEVEEDTLLMKVLQVTFSPDIFPILQVKKHRSDYEEFLTPLVSLLPLGGNADYDYDEDVSDYKDGRVEVEFVHPKKVPVFVENTTKCVAWDRRDNWQLVGEWKTGVCDVIYRTANVTRCLCPVPGHYAVIVIATNVTMAPIMRVQRDTVLLVGCILSLCGLTAALIVFFINWRHMCGDSATIHVNFIMSLAGINLVCILCLSHNERQLLCIASKLALHFLQLAAFSFLLVEAIHTFVCIQSSNFNGITNIKYAGVKYFLIGWGIPTIGTMAVYMLSEVWGFDKICSRWCWWSSGQWQYYSFLALLVVMVLVQVLMMSACLMCTRLWQDERRFAERRRYIYVSLRGFLLQAMLVLLSVAGHLAEERATLGRQWFFVFVDLTLTIVVVMSLLILKPHMRRIIFSILLPAHKRALAFGNFRTFLHPDNVEDSAQVEVTSIQQYCADLNRSKFTSQHKQTLRTLLGSSSSGSEASNGTLSAPGSIGASTRCFAAANNNAAAAAAVAATTTTASYRYPATGNGGCVPTTTATLATLPISRRTPSAGSRSSGSDFGGVVGGGGGGGMGRGGGGRGERRVGGKRTRGKRYPRGHFASPPHPPGGQRTPGGGGGAGGRGRGRGGPLYGGGGGGGGVGGEGKSSPPMHPHQHLHPHPRGLVTLNNPQCVLTVPGGQHADGGGDGGGGTRVGGGGGGHWEGDLNLLPRDLHHHRDLSVPGDSGYEGAESDNASFHREAAGRRDGGGGGGGEGGGGGGGGGAACDHDSQISSDLDLDLPPGVGSGGGSSPHPSSSGSCKASPLTCPPPFPFLLGSSPPSRHSTSSPSSSPTATPSPLQRHSNPHSRRRSGSSDVVMETSSDVVSSSSSSSGGCGGVGDAYNRTAVRPHRRLLASLELEQHVDDVVAEISDEGLLAANDASAESEALLNSPAAAAADVADSEAFLNGDLNVENEALLRRNASSLEQSASEECDTLM